MIAATGGEAGGGGGGLGELRVFRQRLSLGIHGWLELGLALPCSLTDLLGLLRRTLDTQSVTNWVKHLEVCRRRVTGSAVCAHGKSWMHPERARL